MSNIFNFFRKERLHWFQVTLYYNVGNRNVFDFVRTVGLRYKKDILNERKVKKSLLPLHLMTNAKDHLSNGALNLVVNCYLGHFPNPDK